MSDFPGKGSRHRKHDPDKYRGSKLWDNIAANQAARVEKAAEKLREFTDEVELTNQANKARLDADFFLAELNKGDL